MEPDQRQRFAEAVERRKADADARARDPAHETPAASAVDEGVQSPRAELHGLVAPIHCLGYHEAITADPRHPPKELLDEATFHAIRDGLEARLCLGGPVVHVQALARQALNLASGSAPALGCERGLRLMEWLLADGNGADCRRRAFAAGGMAGLLGQLVGEASGARARTRRVPDALGAA